MKKYCSILLFQVFFVCGFPQAPEAHLMKVHYFDVGQGASALLEFSCGTILIDAGAQDKAYEERLIHSLDHFFEKRTDLNRTIDLVIVTHAHKDHNEALDDVVKHFTVKRYIDNGLKNGSGGKNQKWLQSNAKKLGIHYTSYSFEKITKKSDKGLTDTIIDPLNCEEVNPQIILLSGAYDKKPKSWSATDYINGNNQSIVIKVLFDKASFLFTGDLEEEGLNTMLSAYSNDSAIFDVDVLHVGHHGSQNATTRELLNKVTPKVAVISCGKWDYGLGPGDNKLFNTYKFGHPRREVVDLLSSYIEGDRSRPVTVKVADKAESFSDETIHKKIYATAWDHNIIIQADNEGNYHVMTSK